MVRLLQLCLALLLLSGASSHVVGRNSGSHEGSDERDDQWCQRLQCNQDEVCSEINGEHGCSCSEHVPRDRDFGATRTCESSSGSISLSRCQLFDSGFPAKFLHLNNKNCTGNISNGRVEFKFDNRERLCGTTLETNETHFTYMNAVQLYDHPFELISRYSWLSINFSCSYPLIQTLSLPMVVEAKQSVVSRILPGTDGHYDIHMVAYRNGSFQNPYDGMIELEVNQKLFVAVEVKKVDGKQFALVMDNCWATPVNDSNYRIRWDLIKNECPNPRDKTVQMLQNGESLSGRFSFNMFTFTNQSKRLYLHCKVHLCLKKKCHCKPTCGRDNDHDDSHEDDHDDSHEDDHGDNHGNNPDRRRRSLDFHDTAAISMSF